MAEYMPHQWWYKCGKSFDVIWSMWNVNYDMNNLKIVIQTLMYYKHVNASNMTQWMKNSYFKKEYKMFSKIELRFKYNT